MRPGTKWPRDRSTARGLGTSDLSYIALRSEPKYVNDEFCVHTRHTQWSPGWKLCIWPIHPPSLSYSLRWFHHSVNCVTWLLEQLLWMSNIAGDGFTLALLESLVHLIQMLKCAVCVGITCWGPWQRVGIWRPGNENRLFFVIKVIVNYIALRGVSNSLPPHVGGIL